MSKKVSGKPGAVQPTLAPVLPPGLPQDDAHHKARLFDAGLRPEEVAARTGLSEAEAWRAFSGWGRARGKPNRRNTKSGEFYRLRHLRAQVLRAEGLSADAVAKRLGLTTETVLSDTKRVRAMGSQAT